MALLCFKIGEKDYYAVQNKLQLLMAQNLKDDLTTTSQDIAKLNLTPKPIQQYQCRLYNLTSGRYNKK